MSSSPPRFESSDGVPATSAALTSTCQHRGSVAWPPRSSGADSALIAHSIAREAPDRRGTTALMAVIWLSNPAPPPVVVALVPFLDASHPAKTIASLTWSSVKGGRLDAREASMLDA